MNKFTLFFILGCFLTTSSYASQESNTDASGYIKDGWGLIAEGKLNEANVNFQKAVELNPNNVEALQGLAKTYIYLDKNKEAQTILDKILKLDSKNVFAMIYMAKIHAWSNRYNAAIDLYNNALKIEPTNTDAKIGLAEVYLWAGYRKKSVTQYEQILNEDPRNKGVYKGLAETYVWDNRLKEAEHIYQRALKLTPNDIDLHLELARIYRLMASWSSAEREYGKVLELEPKNQAAITGLANVKQERSGRQEFVFRLLREVDGNDWRATTVTYGYKKIAMLDNGNNLFASYYLSNNRETGYSDRIGNILELGGKYAYGDRVDFLGSMNMRNYSNGADFFAGGDFATVFKYFQKNTLALRYNRDLFDIYNEIRSNRYSVESSIYLGNYISINDSYLYGSFSDKNSSIDQVHILNVSLLKKKPDLNLGIGYRNRDFKTTSSLYYSPQNLESIIYSVYCGRAFNKEYVYGLVKFNKNSDHNDTSYFLLGSDYALSKNSSIAVELSYFGSREKYHALTWTVSVRTKF